MNLSHQHQLISFVLNVLVALFPLREKSSKSPLTSPPTVLVNYLQLKLTDKLVLGSIVSEGKDEKYQRTKATLITHNDIVLRVTRRHVTESRKRRDRAENCIEANLDARRFCSANNAPAASAFTCTGGEFPSERVDIIPSLPRKSHRAITRCTRDDRN
jgi:hypothetical protein